MSLDSKIQSVAWDNRVLAIEAIYSVLYLSAAIVWVLKVSWSRIPLTIFAVLYVLGCSLIFGWFAVNDIIYLWIFPGIFVFILNGILIVGLWSGKPSTPKLESTSQSPDNSHHNFSMSHSLRV
jgi:hypothetical protein